MFFRYQNDLPKKIKSRGKDLHLTHDEMVQTIKWKLAVSVKFQPSLLVWQACILEAMKMQLYEGHFSVILKGALCFALLRQKIHNNKMNFTEFWLFYQKQLLQGFLLFFMFEMF